MPGDTPIADIVRWGHRRWVIERYFQDAKELCGMDEYQGRHWQGLHRHLAVVNLAYTWFLHLQAEEKVMDYQPSDCKGPASFSGPPLRAAWRWWLERVYRLVILVLTFSADFIRQLFAP